MGTKLYALPELASVDIDSWVEAMGNLSDRYGGEVDGYNPSEDCPADYEADFCAVAKRHGVLFSANGTIHTEIN